MRYCFFSFYREFTVISPAISQAALNCHDGQPWIDSTVCECLMRNEYLSSVARTVRAQWCNRPCIRWRLAVDHSSTVRAEVADLPNENRLALTMPNMDGSTIVEKIRDESVFRVVQHAHGRFLRVGNVQGCRFTRRIWVVRLQRLVQPVDFTQAAGQAIRVHQRSRSQQIDP